MSSECLERTRYRNNCSGTKIPQQTLAADPCHALWGLVFGGSEMPGGCHTQLLWAQGETTALAEAEEWVTHCPLLLLCFWLSSAAACGKVKGEIFILIFRCSHSHLRMCVCVWTPHRCNMNVFVYQCVSWMALISNSSILLSPQINNNIWPEF